MDASCLRNDQTEREFLAQSEVLVETESELESELNLDFACLSASAASMGSLNYAPQDYD